MALLSFRVTAIRRIYNSGILPNLYFNSIVPMDSYSTSQMSDSNRGPVSLSIEKKIQDSLNPSHLEVINESYQHNVPPGSETHFKVVVVSSKFDEIPLIKRHRLVNEVLSEELNSGVHALSIIAKTSAQWEKSDQIIEKSPPCRGGFGK